MVCKGVGNLYFNGELVAKNLTMEEINMSDTIKFKMEGPIKPEEYNVKVYRNPFTKRVAVKCKDMLAFDMISEFLRINRAPFKEVIFNPPATIVYWGDGSKTVVKCKLDEEYDPQTGFAMAYLKKVYGSQYGHQMRDVRKEYDKQMKAKRDKIEQEQQKRLRKKAFEEIPND